MKWPWYSWREHPRAFIVQIFLGVGAIFVVTVAILAFSTPKVSRTIVASENDRATLLADVRVSFTLPVSREEFTPRIIPEIDGTWSWADPVIAGRLYRTAVFEPSTPLEPDTNYKIEISGITGLLSTKTAKSYTFEFKTQPLPSIKNLIVGSPHKIIDPITIEFDYPADQAVEYFFSLKPEAEIEIVRSADNLTYSLVPKTPLRQGAKYELTTEREIVQFDKELQKVIRRSDRELVQKTEFVTVDPLGIVSVQPQGADILPEIKSISIEFAENIKQESATSLIKLDPTPKGRWTWKSGKIVEFLLEQNLEFEKTYTITVQPGLVAENGSTLLGEGKYSFTTVGALELRSVSPSAKSSGISRNSVITLKFNQPVDKKSVENAISLSPSIPVSMNWKSDSTIVLTPKNLLDYSTQYTVIVAKTAVSQYQKPLRSAFSSSFTTEEKVVILSVPLDKQDRALSCEVASLKMALAFKGIAVSEDQLMSHIGYDPTVRSGGIWGDPDEAFVGDINGSQNSTGYGVHWAPIAKAANNYRKATAHTGMSLQHLTSAIDAGNPIVTWGTYGKAYYDPWNTPSGKLIPAWKGEHARTVIGYKGNPQSPSAIITNDPIAGKITWKSADFDSNWSRLSRAGVIVY